MPEAEYQVLNFKRKKTYENVDSMLNIFCNSKSENINLGGDRIYFFNYENGNTKHIKLSLKDRNVKFSGNTRSHLVKLIEGKIDLFPQK